MIDPESATHNDCLTQLFQRALELLRDDLQRNDPELAERCTVPWASLAAYVVKVHPSLALSVRVASDEEHDCKVKAKVDTTRDAVFVTNSAVLARVDGGGSALAALFKDGARRVAQAWGAACEQAEEGIEPRSIELAGERAASAEAKLNADSRLAEWRDRTRREEPLTSRFCWPGGRARLSHPTPPGPRATSGSSLRLRPLPGHW